MSAKQPTQTRDPVTKLLDWENLPVAVRLRLTEVNWTSSWVSCFTAAVHFNWSIKIASQENNLRVIKLTYCVYQLLHHWSFSIKLGWQVATTVSGPMSAATTKWYPSLALKTNSNKLVYQSIISMLGYWFHPIHWVKPSVLLL